MHTISQDLYTTSATSTGGRSGGSVRSSDGELDVAIRAPKELGGPGGATNPEQLFAAGYAACFHSALTLVASTQGIATDGAEVTVGVRLGKSDEGKYVIAASIQASLPGVDAETTERLVRKAHETCPYSLATDGNIEVEIKAA
jgi:osmotically inducible protein OsmC